MAKGRGKGRGRKSKQATRRRNILFGALGLVVLVGLGLTTIEPVAQPVVELFHQDTQHLVFTPTPQELIGNFGESLTTNCKFRAILFYVTDSGERIQGSISFQKFFSPPFESGSLVSTFTGKTITSFEHDVFLSCNQEVSGADVDVKAIGAQFRTTVLATDFDGTLKNVYEKFEVAKTLSSSSPLTIPDSTGTGDPKRPGIYLLTTKVPAFEIENDLNDTELSFKTTIQFKQSYDVTLLIDNNRETFTGNLKDTYKVDILNNKGSATPLKPTDTSLDLTIIDPPSKVLVSGNVWSFKIDIPLWDQSEGFPSVTIQEPVTNKIIFTKDLPPTGSKGDVITFSDRFKFPGTKDGQYKISASVPAFRPVAVDFITVVATNNLVPRTPEPSQVGGIIQCLQGFTQSGLNCVQDAQNLFIDPTQLASIFGQTLNTIIPFAVGFIIFIVIIVILVTIFKATPAGRALGAGQTIIRLGRQGRGGGRDRTQGTNVGGILPKGFKNTRSAV